MEIDGRFRSDMVDPPLPVRSQIIIAQAIKGGIDDGFQPGFQGDPARRIDLDLENRVLNALAIILAGLGDLSQPAPPARLHRVHVIGHKNHHRERILLPEPRRIGVKIPAQVAGKHLGLKIGHKAKRGAFLKKGMAPFLFLALLPSA